MQGNKADSLHVSVRRMSFGSNGIYVGGKDTFISELTGSWAVKAAVFPQVMQHFSTTAAAGPDRLIRSSDSHRID